MAPSIYEDMRAGDSGRGVDVEERAGLERDEGGHYQEYEYEDASPGEHDSQDVNERGGLLEPIRTHPRGSSQDARKHKGLKKSFMSRSPRIVGEEDDGDDDVPASLLIEEEEEEAAAGPSRPAQTQPHKNRHRSPRAPAASRRTKADAQWQAAQAKQKLYEDIPPPPLARSVAPSNISNSNAKEVAMWQWVNVTNLDTFMGEVYEYYRGGGIWTICLERLLDLW